MEGILKMRPARLKMRMESMDMAGALAWAEEHMDPGTAWLLAESPEKLTWCPLADAPASAELGICVSLTVFCPAAELRFHASYGSASGQARMIVQDETGEAGRERVSTYLLRGRPARLEYAEYFNRDPANGLLRLQFARYCRVVGQ